MLCQVNHVLTDGAQSNRSFVKMHFHSASHRKMHFTINNHLRAKGKISFIMDPKVNVAFQCFMSYINPA
jgi:hypothetical protein